MSYDVFVVAALEDRDLAKLVTRRLRALKMRVWYDAKSTDDQFDEKEARAVHRSKAMLVLWSENAVTSDFVRAAAGTGYSIKDQPFIQAALDDVVPYEPYSADTRNDLKGFTSRTNTEGWFDIVETLEHHQGRKDLREWLLIPTKDKDAQDAWRDRHAKDPLAQKGQPVGVKKAGAATGVAALTGAAAAASVAATRSAPTPIPEPVRPTATAAMATPTAAATQSAAPAAATYDEVDDGTGAAIWWMLAAVAALFLLAWVFRSLQAQPSGLPGVSNTVFATCPAGTMPANLLADDLLSHGQVIVDDD
ncbi:MAG: toll/interleukin-1 receptor domain-containing protein [Pseudomonadota bacterium]